MSVVIHVLKTWPHAFRAVADGIKPYDIRLDDRQFKEGDILVLREYNPATKSHSGSEIHARVTHISRGPEWNLPETMVVMGLAVFQVSLTG